VNAVVSGRFRRPALGTREAQGLAAILAGPLFLATVAVLTLLELDFMHELGWRFTADDEVPWPSGLALGDLGAVQIANFALTGALLALFVRGFRRELPASGSGQLATALLAVVAAAFALCAFPTDRATAAGDAPDTWHGYVHVIGFVVLALGSLAGPLATALALRRDARWRPFPALSIGVVVLEVVFFVPLDFLGDPAFVGYLVALFGWFAALGARLRTLPD
jgi:hypothetical protein